MRSLFLGVYIALCFAVAPNVHSDELVTAIVNPDPFDFQNTVTIGYAFTTGQTALIVTSLGMWDENEDGFSSAVDVGLWDINGNLLGLVNVPSGTGGTLVGEFRYTDLASAVTLDANTDYVLGAFRGPGVAYNAALFDEGIDFTVNPNFDIIEDRASSELGGEPNIVFPSVAFDQDRALIGPNLQFSFLFVLGDANNNGEFNNFDIAAFVLALTDAKLYAVMFPDVDPDEQLDMNDDGVFDNFDIAAFVAALTGG